jgi:hypothetical protein
LFKIVKKYYKKPRRGEPIIRYKAKDSNENFRLDKGDKIIIRIDPALKKRRDIERSLMKHEKTELMLRAKGVKLNKAHRIARSKEPKLTRNKSLNDIWKML